MHIPKQLARHFRELIFGDNWTASDLKHHISDITWQEANAQVGDHNTIAALVYHIHYFVRVTLVVLQGGPLDGHDKYSFDVPPIRSAEDWDHFLQEVFETANTFADTLEKLPESRLWENLADAKYGSCYRNIQGVIEHSYYHLGQIVLIRKMLRGG